MYYKLIKKPQKTGRFFKSKKTMQKLLLSIIILVSTGALQAKAFKHIKRIFQKPNTTCFLLDLLSEQAPQKVLIPFMAYELKDKFNLNDALAYGLLPLRFDTENPTATLQGLISRYIKEEIFAKGLIRHREQFIRFLQAMTFSHGTQLNIANVAHECHVKRTTVHDWIAILEDLFLCFQLDVFTQNAKQALSAHPKFYFFDTGVYKVLQPTSIDTCESIGAGLEGLVAQHLVAWRDYTTEKHELNFWRTRSDKEVDFVLYGPLGFWAIEVKNSGTIHPKDLKGLIAFGKDYPEAKRILLYRGKEKLMKNGVLCLPCEDFLKKLCPEMPLDVAF